MKEIKWAVLGCGVIANEMAVALQKTERIFTRSATGPMRRRLLCGEIWNWKSLR